MVSPLYADLTGLPPATVLTVEVDPLRDQGRLFAETLKAAKVPVVYKHYEGITHEAFGMGLVVDVAKTANMDAASELKKAFTK